MATLDDLNIGQSGRVTKMDLAPSEAQRLMEMGLTAGAGIKILKRAPLGDPIEILVRGYHLSLRRAEARLIFIELQ